MNVKLLTDVKNNNAIKPLILRTGKAQIIEIKGTSYVSANNSINIYTQIVKITKDQDDLP